MIASRKLEILHAFLSFDYREPDKTIGMWQDLAGIEQFYIDRETKYMMLRQFLNLEQRQQADDLWEKLEHRLILNYELKELK
jgi:hypothetical protein